MTLDIAAVLRDGWRLWRRDRSLLSPLTGLLLFVPQWALLLLVPEAPRIGDGPDERAALTAWSEALSGWIAANGGWYVAAMMLAQLATLTVSACYLARPARDVGGALVKALRLLLRYILAGLAVALPLGAIAWAALPLPLGILLAVPPIFYALGRTCLVAPVIVAEPGTGVWAALARSWALTKGRGIGVAVLVGGLTAAGQLAASIVIAIDHVLKVGGMGNPVTLAIVDAGAAGATWASALALALVEVVLYRRLAR
jgi:hypothetical protein